MPRKAIDYSKTVIYKLICCNPEIKDIYVGSTTDFRRRKSDHKRDCNNPNRKGYGELKYVTIRANGGWDNWKMIEIEKYPCKDNREAEAREQHYIETLNATLNMNKAFSGCETIQEYKKQYGENYYNINKDKIKEKTKKYYENNKKKILEKQKVYNKQYKEINKEKINQKYNCECGGNYTHTNRAVHFTRLIHQKYLETKLATETEPVEI